MYLPMDINYWYIFFLLTISTSCPVALVVSCVEVKIVTEVNLSASELREFPFAEP